MITSSTRYPSPMALYALLLSCAFLGIFLLICLTPTRLHAEVTQDGTIGVIHTVGTAQGYCPETRVIAVPTGTTVYFCFTIVNSTPVTLNTHTFTFTVDPPLPIVSRTFSSELPPGEKLAVTTGYLLSLKIAPDPLQTQVNGNVTSTVTVLSRSEDEQEYTGEGTARALVGQATTVVTQTVGIIADDCADTESIAVTSGKTVYYCVTIVDTGTLDFVRHEISAPQLGANFVYTPANPATSPQQIINRLEKVITAPFTNIITVTSYTDEGVVTKSSAAAVAVIGSATATLTYTVGTNPNACATTKTLSILTNTTVYYCLQLKNTGTLPLERFTINAPQLSLQKSLTRTVGVGESMILTTSFDAKLAKLTTGGETNNITVDAYTANGVRVRNEPSVTITVGTLLISVTKYARTTNEGCVTTPPLNTLTTTQFFYCVVIRNTGSAPITGFTLTEPTPTNINFSFDYPLGVGQTITLTNDFLANTLKIGSFLGPFVTTGNINASLTVTAKAANGATVPASAAFQINVAVPTATPVPTLTPSLTWTPTQTPIPTTTPTVPPTPTPTNVVLSILPTATDPFGLGAVTTPIPGAPTDMPEGFVPDSPLQDSFLETPTPTIDFFATEVAVTEAAVTAAALALEAEATQAALLTEQALPPTPTDTPLPTMTPEASATPTETALPVIAVLPPNGAPALNADSSAPSGVTTVNGDYLGLLAATFATSAATLGWLWFLAGSIIFFAVAGMFAGLSFRQQERRRYRMVDEKMAENDLADFDDDQPFGDDPFDNNPFVADRFADTPLTNRGASMDPWPPNAPVDRSAGRDAADDDYWPASLP